MTTVNFTHNQAQLSSFSSEQKQNDQETRIHTTIKNPLHEVKKNHSESFYTSKEFNETYLSESEEESFDSTLPEETLDLEMVRIEMAKLADYEESDEYRKDMKAQFSKEMKLTRAKIARDNAPITRLIQRQQCQNRTILVCLYFSPSCVFLSAIAIVIYLSV